MTLKQNKQKVIVGHAPINVQLFNKHKDIGYNVIAMPIIDISWRNRKEKNGACVVASRLVAYFIKVGVGECRTRCFHNYLKKLDNRNKIIIIYRFSVFCHICLNIMMENKLETR